MLAENAQADAQLITALRDAVGALGKVGQAAIEGRRAVGDWLVGLGSKLQGEKDSVVDRDR